MITKKPNIENKNLGKNLVGRMQRLVVDSSRFENGQSNAIGWAFSQSRPMKILIL